MAMTQELYELADRWPLISKFRPLPTDAVVAVVGAYKGITMELIDEVYHPSAIIGFEPQEWAWQEARERLAERFNCTVLHFAMGDKTGKFPMGEWNTDAASFINTGPGSREQGIGEMMDAQWIFDTLFIEPVDLMIMNIEGGEFELLPYLQQSGLLSRINRLAVQFHLGFGNDDNYLDIIQMLGEEYRFFTDMLPAWGYWTRS